MTRRRRQCECFLDKLGGSEAAVGIHAVAITPDSTIVVIIVVVSCDCACDTILTGSLGSETCWRGVMILCL